MRILIAELKQETATFNPAPTRYADFHVYRGDEILSAYRGTKTELAGAMDCFAREGVEVAPTVAASAVSGGPIAAADLDRLLSELVQSAARHRDVDRRLRLLARGDGRRERGRSGRSIADGIPQHFWPASDRCLARSACGAHRSHVGSGRSARAVSHLPARRPLRDGPARRCAICCGCFAMKCSRRPFASNCPCWCAATNCSRPQACSAKRSACASKSKPRPAACLPAC